MTTAITSRVAAPIAAIYRTNAGLFGKALEGLTESDLWYHPTDDTNPMLWIAGHMVQGRALVLKLMGEEFETGWGKLFGRGCKVIEPSQYPKVEEIVTTMKEVNARLKLRFETIGDEQLAPPPSGFGFPNCTCLADELAFLAMHDSFHIGQLSYLRRARGLCGIAG